MSTAAGGPKVAMVFCVHHKPWLMMSTLITTLLQDHHEADFYFLYQLGDGTCPGRPSYREYHALVARHGTDPQVSPFDERVRQVCRIGRERLFELEFENDSALDSGAWYRFIKTGLWRQYDYVFFLGEGALLTRANAASAMVRFAQTHGAHFIASGHEKRRLPKDLVMRYNQHREHPTAMHAYHDRMIAEVFERFCRDPGFQALFDRWPSDFEAETQNHVPDIWSRHAWWYRARNAASTRSNTSTNRIAKRWRPSPRFFYAMDALAARASVGIGNVLPAVAGATDRASGAGPRRSARIHVNGVPRDAMSVVDALQEGGVTFHQVREPEWFGCTVLHLMSRPLLDRFAAKLEEHRLYDVLDLPFAGTALEIVWGFLPAWLGYDKWFTDGFHRVRKHFVTYRREDDPAGMASYINRYHRGLLYAGAQGERVTVRALRKPYARLRQELNPLYFGGRP